MTIFPRLDITMSYYNTTFACPFFLFSFQSGMKIGVRIFMNIVVSHQRKIFLLAFDFSHETLVVNYFRNLIVLISKFKIFQSLSQIEYSSLTAGEELYCNLRRRSKEQRATQHDNTDMCKLLLQALRKRDRLQQDLFKHVEWVLFLWEWLTVLTYVI